MLPDGYVCHRTHERIRIRIPSKRGSAEFFASVRAQFADLEGVEKLEINHLTASVLLVTRTETRTIADHAAANGLFALKEPTADSTMLSRRMAGDFNRLNEQVKRLTGGEIDVPGLTFLGLLVVGFYQIGIGNFTAPAWYTAFWYAMNILVKGHQSDP